MVRNLKAIFLTGVTGLVGGGVLQRMLAANHNLHAFVLVRDEARWRAAVARYALPTRRVTPLVGDVRQSGLGLPWEARLRLAREVEAVLHFAADTTFSLPLPETHAVNVQGTRHVLELFTDWPGARHFVFASTAFVAGRRVGMIRDDDPAEEESTAAGWVNHYEECKYDAERLVRASGREWVIFRPSSIACEAATGAVHQFNVVHRTLRLYHHGLAPMLPGDEGALVDTVPSEYVNDAIAKLAFHPDAVGRTLHLCAGTGALPLGELLNLTYGIWAESPQWRHRGISRPAITDLETYQLFERSVEEAGEARLAQVMRSLSYFIPQLAYPKRFDTSGADTVLGTPAPEVRSYWPRMITHLLETDWAASIRASR